MQKTTNDQGNQNSGSLSNQETATKNQNEEAAKTYTCSMHPEVVSDKPGKCPKCGMKLIEKKS
ncbi:MAG TPA: heavy metal-binding domain-containing protein [Chitinophagaceae bacterium]|nr:heavy metal-binding domain-containing protein [Chitinophagaceae bacterium]